jgi:two-component system sensor histidine kinase/response regulator
MNMEERGKYDFDFSGRRVLVVEDNPVSFKLVEIALSRVKAEVVRAPNGRVGVELCMEKGPFDMVIMDLQMPEVDGLEATRQIKRLYPGLPVVLATASTFDGDVSACREAGCDHVIPKPFQFQKLFLLMELWLQGQK